MKESISSISKWAEDTFGQAGSIYRVATRANEEMAELLNAVELAPEKAPEEAADVAIILCRLADRLKIGADINYPIRVETSSPLSHAASANQAMSMVISEARLIVPDSLTMTRAMNGVLGNLSQLCMAFGTTLGEQIDRKMEINRNRQWDRDGSGHGYHRKHVDPVTTVKYDLSPAMTESAITQKLIELGWTPPPPPGRAAYLQHLGRIKRVSNPFPYYTMRKHSAEYRHAVDAIGTWFFALQHLIWIPLRIQLRAHGACPDCGETIGHREGCYRDFVAASSGPQVDAGIVDYDANPGETLPDGPYLPPIDDEVIAAAADQIAPEITEVAELPNERVLAYVGQDAFQPERIDLPRPAAFMWLERKSDFQEPSLQFDKHIPFQPQVDTMELFTANQVDIHVQKVLKRDRWYRELLEAERTLLRSGLQFYASQASYSPSWLSDDRFHVMEDRGRVAKNALESADKVRQRGGQ